MGDVSPFAGLTETIAFDRLRQDHGGLPCVLYRGLVSGVEFSRIVSTSQHLVNLLIGMALNQLEESRIGSEEMFPGEGAAFHHILLIPAVHHLAHTLDQQAFIVLRQQRIPITAPNHLDDFPAGAKEDRFQLLDDFAVAAYRTVETLKITIDDPDEIVEPFARSERERAEAFRFIGFAVADERPYALLARVLEAAVL